MKIIENNKNQRILKCIIFLILFILAFGLVCYSEKRIYYLLYSACIFGACIASKYKKQLMIILFGFGIVMMIIYSVRITIPFIMMLNINKDFVAVDSNWHPDKSNPYHNDALLYTILQNKNCYINPDCWYTRYVQTLGSNVFLDKEVSAVVNSDNIENISSYVELGFSRATNHVTLYTEEQRNLITKYESETGIATKLYIAFDGIITGDSVVFFNDDKGNIYIRTLNNE